MAEYPRDELEEMMRRWLEANRHAEQEGNWIKHLGPFYTDDAVYRWNMGPNEEFGAHGRKEIEQIALGYQMAGFEDWAYTYDDVIIDDKRGEVIGMWRQVAPFNREDGNPYEIAGVGGSWFRYGGNYKWEWQRDFFDLGNAKAIFFELAGAGVLNDTIRKKIHTQARGKLLPGHRKIRAEPSAIRKTRNALAMVKIALFG